MKLSFYLPYAVIAFIANCMKVTSSDVNMDTEYLSLRGRANFEQSPTYFHDMKAILEQKKAGSGGLKNLRELEPENECNPAEVDLIDYPQWEAEVGYWIGEYTYSDGDGNPFVSSMWNYPYDHYKGFITGNVNGNKYRQRNVFLYPPQYEDLCADGNSVVGEGKCGKHGNSKIFMADQEVTTCDTNTELRGDIEGRYEGVFNTKTELIGRDNALLYQVYLDKTVFKLPQDQLYQSQLTTLTTDESGNLFRTRSAQGSPFAGVPVSSSMSYYRERKVSKKEFYNGLKEAKTEFKIKGSDFCAWKNDDTGKVISTSFSGFQACKSHLEESFEL
mmetsp:Transcript_46320/g.47021  ORF Transcript_46320/g.47021 Transcript_46320/m.47021 type:complete len:331 (-) Transcript_46320:206-1198(-)